VQRRATRATVPSNMAALAQRRRRTGPLADAAARQLATDVYNERFIHQAIRENMEAEQLNLIENRLADLGQRATELRRYL
jgi:hypothetical protein